MIKDNLQSSEGMKAMDKNSEKIKKDKIIKIKESEYKKIVQEAAEYKDKHIRLYAEFDNARKRMEREKIEFIKYANEGLILDILDDLERSIDVARAQHQDYSAFLKGIEMVMTHVHALLKKNGVKPIEARGKLFDPHCHEVLFQEENDDVDEDLVLEELQKGYYLGDKVVRTAKVKLAKKAGLEKKQAEGFEEEKQIENSENSDDTTQEEIA